MTGGSDRADAGRRRCRAATLRLMPPRFVPLDDDRRARALAALTELLAHALNERTRGADPSKEAAGEGPPSHGRGAPTDADG